MFWFRTNNIKSEFLSMYISDTALRNSPGILPLDTIKNWLLTNIFLIMAFPLEWEVKVKQIYLI